MKSYVCVLSTDNYLDGVLVLNENLQRIKSNYPLLCIINENISSKTRNILTYFGIMYKEMKNIKYSENSNSERYVNYGYNKGYLKNTFDKLNIFSLVEFEKIVYLDSDLLILENIDNLFNYPHLSCPRDLPFNMTKFNSGVMVLEPNIDDFKELKERAIEASKENRKISDQDIINEYFLDKITPLDYGYNMVREISEVYVSYFDGVFKCPINRRGVGYFLENTPENKIIHYIGKIKPFMISDGFDDDYSYLYQYYLNIVKRLKNLYECNLQDELVSIIIPVYNKEKYLERCLNTVCSQSYSNVEIILINDGSTDKSLDICNKYIENDSRIRIINQENSGVSSARNIGIKEASGRYISFVDADDYVEPNYIEELVRGIKKYNVDFVQCGTIINDEKVLYCQDQEMIFSNNKEVTIDFLGRGMSGTIWDKLYKKELLEDLQFDEKYNKNEDTLFVLEVVKKANTFVRIGLPLYHYTYKKSDSLTSSFSLEKDYNLLLYLDSVYAFVFDNYPDLDIFLYKFEFILLRYMLRELDHLDSISSIDRNDKMVLSIIDRLQRLNTLGEERPELKEIFERKDENGYQ